MFHPHFITSHDSLIFIKDKHLNEHRCLKNNPKWEKPSDLTCLWSDNMDNKQLATRGRLRWFWFLHWPSCELFHKNNNLHVHSEAAGPGISFYRKVSVFLSKCIEIKCEIIISHQNDSIEIKTSDEVYNYHLVQYFF